MRMRIRFITFFISGLLLFVLSMSLFIAFFLEYVLPTPDNDVLLIIVVIIPFVIGGAALGVIFVNPLLFMLSLVKKLSTGQYDLSQVVNRVHKRNGKLKIRYSLYKELISDLSALAGNLRETEIQRKQLEDAKTNWIAGVSHDLKTPLSYVTGYSALLLSENYTWDIEETRRFLTQIYDKSVYIGELINDLNLSFEQGVPKLPLIKETFDLIDFMRSLIADIANTPNATEYILEFQTTENHLFISADKKLLRRAFQNLLVNAMRHNPHGTSIMVGIKKGKAGQVIVSVSDNGAGMEWPPKDTEEKPGRGLSIVENIISAHGGSFTIESKPMQGTLCKIKCYNLLHH